MVASSWDSIRNRSTAHWQDSCGCGSPEKMPTRMPLKAIAFDWGHTLMDERRDEHIPLDNRPVHLMPGVADVLQKLTLPLAVWANTRVARETAVRGWLDRGGLDPLFQWVITS